VDYIQAILDKRIPIKLLQVPDGENVIYCNKFTDQLFDTASISTKEKDFVHNYILENGQRYILTDVSTEDGKTYKDVKFKVVVVENGEVPYSRFSPGKTKILNEKVVLPETKITEELNILEPTKRNDLEKTKLKQVEERLENKKNSLIREEHELLEKKRIAKEEKEKAIQEQKEKEKEIQEKYKIIKEAKDDIIASSRQYLEEKIKASSEENKNYARRILELGGGGGSVAVQYANGGTMNGDLNVNGTVAATGGNSNQWNSTYTTVKSLSDSWEESAIISPLQSASANWNSTYTSVSEASANWDSTYTSVSETSADWNSTYTSVSEASADWNSTYTSVSETSADWNSTYSSVSNTSGNWNSVYSTVKSLSDSWEESADIIPTVVNYLSTNNILLSGVTISPIATNRNLARSLQDKFTEILSVNDFGAKGDGVSNDYAAIQSALNAISGTARLFIPRGTYVISQELKIGSNSYIYGEGIDTSIIRLSSTATASQNVLTNSQNTRSYLTNQGNENIVIKDLTVDGNNSRFSGSYSPGTNTNGCCIGFANVTNAIIENVGAYNAPNHCIDIAASEYAISTNPVVYTPGPSTQVHLKNVKAYGSGDDCITTHFSRNVLIENCYVTGSSGTLVPTNANGLEIDDGSYDIFVLGGYVKNCIRGIEIKGHATAPAAKRVRVEGLTVENCTRNFDLRHIGFDSGNSATAFDVQLLNCTSISPVSTNTDAALRPRYLKISNYGGVVVRDFTCAGLCDTTNLVAIQEGAKDVLIDGLSFQSISGSSTGITNALLKIESDTLRNVTLRNIRFYNCVGLPLYATGSVPGLVIDGLYATTTINPSSNYVINISWSPADVPYTIKNVSTTGYLSAYTLGTINADYSTPRNVEFIENIVPANASRALTVARFGWREGDSQGLNAGVGTRIDFTGNIFTGVSANQNVTVGYVGTEKINGTDTDLSSNLVLGTADSNSISASNKMLISPTGNVLIGTGSTVGLNSKLTVLGTISSTGVIFTTGGNSNNWNSTYTSLNTNSAKYDSVYTQTTNLSTYWAGNSLLIYSDTYVDSSVSNYLVDSGTQSIICYLPTNPQYGTTFTFQDMFNNWNTYSLTISSNDNMIMGKPLFEPLICDVPGITFTIVYVGGSWGWKVQ